MDDDIRRLIDQQAIIDLGLRYAKALDGRDRAAMRACFHPDGVLSMMSLGDFVGIEAIEQALGIIGTLDLTQHVITNQLVAINGDRATMESYIIATHLKHDHPGGPVFTAGGSYFDELARDAGEWRIVRRTAKMLWMTGNSAMLFPTGP